MEEEVYAIWLRNVCFFLFNLLAWAKNIELANLEEVYFDFYLAVNNLITDKMQNIFSLIADPSGFIYLKQNSLNYLN